jgi:tape measure domain-containing protein
MAKLSFAIALNLLTEGFKKGTSQVKSGLSSIKSSAMSVAAYFGVGFLSIKVVFDKLKEAGVETAKAMATLKANSGGVVQTGQNLNFLKGIANQYKLELNGLVMTYSKFTAAATTSGFTMKQQQSIFEGVQKAMKAYKLSEEDQATVMGSVQKIMNTGQISTRNFTNSLLRAMPQAKQALADAMGVGVDKINALVKKGIDAKKVLESFATKLKIESPEVDTNNLASAKNRIANAFNGMATDTNITGWLAKVMNKAADAMEYIRRNIRSLVYDIIGLFAGIKIGRFFTQMQAFSKASSDAMVTNAQVAHSKVRMLENQTARLKRNVTEATTTVEKAGADERLAAEVQLNTKKRALASAELNLTKAKNAAKVADERAAAVMSGNAWTSAWAKIKTGATALGTSLKTMWASVGPMVLITAFTELIMKITESVQGMKELKKEWNDYKSAGKSATHTQEIEQLKQMQRIMNSTNRSTKEHKTVISQINNQLGTQLTNENSINDAIRKRIKLLEATAEVNFYTNRKLEAEAARQDLYAKYGGENNFTKRIGNLGSTSNPFGVIGSWAKSIFSENNDITVRRDARQDFTYTKIISDADKHIADATSFIMKNGGYPDSHFMSGGGGGGTGKTGKGGKVDKTEDPAAEELKSAREQYAQQMRELTVKAALENMTDEDYNNAKRAIVSQSLVQVKSSRYASVANSDFAKTLSEESTKLKNNKAIDDIGTFMNKYNADLEKERQKHAAGVTTTDEYNKAIYDLSVEAYKELASMADVNNGNIDYISALASATTAISTRTKSTKFGNVNDYKRDTTFDYKKDTTEKLSEEVESAQRLLDALTNGTLKVSGNLADEINKQMGKVTSLNEALKLAEVRKDVKQFSKDLKNQAWSSVKEIMNGSDQIVDSWTQLGKTLNDADATGWEKIMAIWKALETSVDGITAIVQSVKDWTDASEKLKDAKTTEAAVTTAANATETTSNTAAAAVNTATTETGLMENQKAVAGNMAEAGSEVVKNNAKIPIVGIALAAAGLIAVLALMSKLPKFAKGGIVGGGSTSGDNMLARVNSGEMILNGSQQKRLFNAIDKGHLSGNDVTIRSIKVRGSDMYLALKNYMKQTGKTL